MSGLKDFRLVAWPRIPDVKVFYLHHRLHKEASLLNMYSTSTSSVVAMIASTLAETGQK